MKKLAMLAVASIIGASAFAQDVFKQISKIKDYNEAYNLLKSNLSSISAEEKAKCYNALVDLAMNKVAKEQGTITENQMAEQMKTKVTPYDTVGLYNAVLNAFECGVACDEFDNQPNEKGKVKPKFHKSNGDRLYANRFHLINGGIYYQNTDQPKAYKFLATYVDSNDYPLFSEQDKSKDESLAQMAYYAARFAYLEKDFANAEKYADVAMKDASVANDALQLKMISMQSQLKTHADSLEYINKLKALYAKDENNDVVFSTLCSMLSATNNNAEFDNLINAKLAKDPNNFNALALRGQSKFSVRKWDEAIVDLKKASDIQPENAVVLGLIGNSYMYKAQEAAEKASAKGGSIPKAAEDVIIGVYKQAIDYLEKAKNVDKNMQFKNVWAYSLYTCCYRIYGADDQKTKDAEALTK